MFVWHQFRSKSNPSEMPRSYLHFGNLHQGGVCVSEGTEYNMAVSFVPGAALYAAAAVKVKTGLRGKLGVVAWKML